MASFTGKDGSLTLTGTNFDEVTDLCIQSWTIDIEGITDQFVCMAADGNWGCTLSGGNRWSASAETSYDDTLGTDFSNITGASIAMLFDAGNIYMSGFGFVNAEPTTVNVDGRATLSWSITGTGELVEST